MDADTWAQIKTCKKWGSLDGGYPDFMIHLFSPDDDVHRAVVLHTKSARQALHGCMYGWDDTEVDQLFRDAWKSQAILFKLALDATQAAGRGETPLLKQWPQTAYGSALVIGQSRFHKINHDKMIVADDASLFGSTNLSADGEGKQNNEALFIWNARIAQEAQTKVSLIFAEMLAQPGALSHKDLLGAAA